MADHGLTAAQRKRLAREMRKLAMECVEGTAPKLAVGWIDSACAVKHAALRSDVPIDSFWWATLNVWGLKFGSAARHALTLVSIANDYSQPADRPFAVVFPLLAAADAIEAADV